MSSSGQYYKKDLILCDIVLQFLSLDEKQLLSNILKVLIFLLTPSLGIKQNTFYPSKQSWSDMMGMQFCHTESGKRGCWKNNSENCQSANWCDTNATNTFSSLRSSVQFVWSQLNSIKPKKTIIIFRMARQQVIHLSNATLLLSLFFAYIRA